MSMCKMRAWELLNEMSFVRVAGSPEDLKCAEILKAHCDAAGVPTMKSIWIWESFSVQGSSSGSGRPSARPSARWQEAFSSISVV